MPVTSAVAGALPATTSVSAVFDRVSWTVIDDLEILLRINDHRLARIGEAQRVADQLVLVIEDRNGEAVGLRFVSDRLARIGVRRA